MVPNRIEYSRVVRTKLVSIARDGGVDDIEAYIDEIRRLSELSEALNRLDPALRSGARASLDAGNQYAFRRCAACDSLFHNDPSYRWCRHHVADTDVVVDWSKYSSLKTNQLKTLPESLRIAPSGKLADTLRLLCKKLGLSEVGDRNACASRPGNVLRSRLLPTAFNDNHTTQR